MAALSIARGAAALAALAALTLAPSPAQAQNVTLDFAGLVPGDVIPPTYGSDVGVISIANRSVTGFGNLPTPGCTHIRMYAAGYAGLADAVATCDAGLVGEFVVVPWPGSGQAVTLNSLRLGAWQGGPHPWEVRVYDNLWNLRFQQSGVGSPAPVTVTPNVSSSQGLYLQWGEDWNTAVDDISLTLAAPLATPEPGSLALVAGGLALVGAVARGRRRRGAA